jgi:FAD:protein FMN transferase
VLKGRGINCALVAASGDIAVGNPPPGQQGWKVGITGIDVRSNELVDSLRLHNVGISTSGDTEQFIEIAGVRYSHILSPATGLGLTNRIQATVIAPGATATDALATTLCVLGPDRALALVERLPRTAALILTKEAGTSRMLRSRRFPRVPPD